MVGIKVMITYTTANEITRRSDFYDYLNQLVMPEGSMVLPNHGRSPAKSRNMLIEAAQEHKCTHILFIDDDNTFEPDALHKLLKWDKDIVSGLYLSKAYPHQPLVFDLADDKGSCAPMYLMCDDNEKLKSIVAAGFGFLLVKMDVFNKLEKPYVRLGELNPEEWCDDIGFFNRVRKAGIQSYCDMTCYIGHFATMIVKPYRDKNGNWYTNYDTAGTGSINTPQFNPSVKYAFEDK